MSQGTHSRAYVIGGWKLSGFCFMSTTIKSTARHDQMLCGAFLMIFYLLEKLISYLQTHELYITSTVQTALIPLVRSFSGKISWYILPMKQAEIVPRYSDNPHKPASPRRSYTSTLRIQNADKNSGNRNLWFRQWQIHHLQPWFSRE